MRLFCRPVTGLPIRSHCFVWVTCPEEGWDFVLSLYGNPPFINSTGYKRITTMRDPTSPDDPYSPANNYNRVIQPQNCNPKCAYETSILDKFNQAQSPRFYGGFDQNSNTFAQDLITSGGFGTGLPADAPGSAPGFRPWAAGRIR